MRSHRRLGWSPAMAIHRRQFDAGSRSARLVTARHQQAPHCDKPCQAVSTRSPMQRGCRTAVLPMAARHVERMITETIRDSPVNRAAREVVTSARAWHVRHLDGGAVHRSVGKSSALANVISNDDGDEARRLQNRQGRNRVSAPVTVGVAAVSSIWHGVHCAITRAFGNTARRSAGRRQTALAAETGALFAGAGHHPTSRRRRMASPVRRRRRHCAGRWQRAVTSRRHGGDL